MPDRALFRFPTVGLWSVGLAAWSTTNRLLRWSVAPIGSTKPGSRLLPPGAPLGAQMPPRCRQRPVTPSAASVRSVMPGASVLRRRRPARARRRLGRRRDPKACVRERAPRARRRGASRDRHHPRDRLSNPLFGRRRSAVVCLSTGCRLAWVNQVMENAALARRRQRGPAWRMRLMCGRLRRRSTGYVSSSPQCCTGSAGGASPRTTSPSSRFAPGSGALAQYLHTSLAVRRVLEGRYDDAIEHLREAERVTPDI